RSSSSMTREPAEAFCRILKRLPVKPLTSVTGPAVSLRLRPQLSARGISVRVATRQAAPRRKRKRIAMAIEGRDTAIARLVTSAEGIDSDEDEGRILGSGSCVPADVCLDRHRDGERPDQRILHHSLLDAGWRTPRHSHPRVGEQQLNAN